MNSLTKEDQGGQISLPPSAENGLRGSDHLGEDIMRVMDFTNTENLSFTQLENCSKVEDRGHKVAMKLSA